MKMIRIALGQKAETLLKVLSCQDIEVLWPIKLLADPKTIDVKLVASRFPRVARQF
jgi:hypothetical protein